MQFETTPDNISRGVIHLTVEETEVVHNLFLRFFVDKASDPAPLSAKEDEMVRIGGMILEYASAVHAKRYLGGDHEMMAFLADVIGSYAHVLPNAQSTLGLTLADNIHSASRLLEANAASGDSILSNEQIDALLQSIEIPDTAEGLG